MTIESRDTYGKGGKAERSISVLKLFANHEAGVTFIHPDANQSDAAAHSERLVKVGHADWVDLGSPDTLTIVLYPGDVIDQLPRHVGSPMLAKVQVVRAHEYGDDQFYVRGIAKNGEPLWTSETYHDIRTARKHAESYGIEVEEELDG